MHCSERWTRVPADPVDRFCVGVDLGQAQDPTAIAVVRHRVVPLSTWTPDRTTDRNARSILTQDVNETFECPHLERVPLGTSYPQIVQQVAEMLTRPPLRGAELVVDETGVGRPVSELFERAAIEPIRVCITAGFEPQKHGRRRWSVPKTELISNLDALMHTGALKIASALREAPALAEELKEFRRHLTDAGRSTYSARSGKHDDLVLAVALGSWWLCRGRPRGESGTYPYLGAY
jgi:hypothetical protein